MLFRHRCIGPPRFDCTRYLRKRSVSSDPGNRCGGVNDGRWRQSEEGESKLQAILGVGYFIDSWIETFITLLSIDKGVDTNNKQDRCDAETLARGEQN